MSTTDTPTTPLVTVVMPVYNGERHLAAAVRSILEQSFTDLELLVVDDGSSDGSAALAASTGDPRVRVLRAAHGGEGAARNLGVREARGRWVAWQDADDVALPHRLTSLLDAVEGGADFAHHDMVLIDEEDQPLGYLASSAIPTAHVLQHLLHEGTPYNNPTMLVRRGLLASVPCDETLRIGVDTDLVRRFAPRSRGAHVPEPLTLYRRHVGSLTAGAPLSDGWPHLRGLLDERLEDLVPLAFSCGVGAPGAVGLALVGLALVRRGFVDGGVEHFQRAAVGPHDERSGALVGACVDLAGQNPRAALAKLLPLVTGAPDPQGCLPAVLAGDAHAALHDLLPAFRLYQRALAIDPSSYSAATGVRAVGQAVGLRAVDDPRRRLMGLLG